MTPRPRRKPSPHRNEQGQTIILVAVMVLSFLMFFGFTLNTGLLINAKISVQAAADAAAYAGAATQARQLNAVSYLNYDMRRQFKKFLFRNFVAGSIGNPNFPLNSDGSNSSPHDFPKLDFTGTSVGAGPKKVPLRVPVVCIPVVANVNDDQCVKLNVRNTSKDLKDRIGSFATAAGGSILQTLLQQVTTLQNTQQAACAGQAGINLATMLAWLFRGSMEDGGIDKMIELATGSSVPLPNLKATLVGLTKGLGLYPRNILNLMRIETLETFLNEEPKIVGREDALALERNVRTAEASERTILAYKSALANLNTTVFNTDELVLEELQAPGPMINLEVVTADLDVFIQSTKATPGPADTICNSFVYNFPIQKVPVGVKINPISGRNVVYAVRVRAKVRPRGLLFLPGNEALELEAMGGAKPFGSRIGPRNLAGSDFLKDGGPTDLGSVRVSGEHICKPADPVDHKCNVPDLQMFGAAGSGAGGFFDSTFLSEMREMIGKPASTENIIRAQYHAMAPNPTEVGHYNIIPPPGASAPGTPPSDVASEFISTYDGREKPAGSDFVAPAYRFYAPIYRADSSVDINTYIDKFLKSSLPNTIPNEYGLSGEQVRTQTADALQTYIKGPLQAANGSELRETETFAAVELPMAWLTPPKKGNFWLTNAREVLSSWAPGMAFSTYKPRFGYSVRFVALRDLASQGVAPQDSVLDTISH
jgi:hypothetical protein